MMAGDHSDSDDDAWRPPPPPLQGLTIPYCVVLGENGEPEAHRDVHEVLEETRRAIEELERGGQSESSP